KTLFQLGESSVHELAEQLRVAPFIVEGVFQRLRKEQLMQAVGMTGSAHRGTLTQAGRVRSSELLGVDQCVGPVPVSLEDYVERVKSQSVRDIVAHEPDVQKAFKDMVLDAEVLSQLGTAVVSGRAIFIYGPPGTGKTTVAECLSEIFRKEAIWI